jgi:hypothetical protein
MCEENTVTVVIPAFDEAGFGDEVVDTVPEFADGVYSGDARATQTIVRKS